MAGKEKLNILLRTKKFQYTVILVLVCAVIPAVMAFFTTDNSVINLFSEIVIFSIFAASWNFLANSGQGSLGHSVFFGIGGFSSAILGSTIAKALMAALGLSFLPVGPLTVVILVLTLFIGGLLSAAIGLLIGLVCVRLKAWYLAIVTFGFSVIATSLSNQFDAITQGINGFQTVRLVAAGYPFYLTTLLFAVFSVVTMFLIMRSRMGFAFKTIHQNEAEAKMIGINTTKYKLWAFVISTFFAGIAGGLFAYKTGVIDNSIFAPSYSFLPLIISVIGGLGTVIGPIIGAIFYEAILKILSLVPVTNAMQTVFGSLFPNVASVSSPLSMVIIGVLLLVIVIFAPEGLKGLLNKLYKALTAPETPKPKKEPELVKKQEKKNERH